MSVKSDIEIAREAKMKPIAEVGKRIGIPDSALLNYGPYKAKVSFDFIDGGAEEQGRQADPGHRDHARRPPARARPRPRSASATASTASARRP